MAVIYGNGAAMGFTPQQVDAMSIWQFNAAWSGWIKSKGPAKETLSEELASELFDWLERDDPPKPVAPGFSYGTESREASGRVVTALTWGGGQVDVFQAMVS